jgi:hypothetical protein
MSLVYTSFSRLAQASITRRGIANRAPPREVQKPKSENHSDPRRFLYRANRTVGKGNFREVVRKELARQFARDQGMKVSTANNSLRVLRRILNLAVEWGVLEGTPKIKILPGESRRERVALLVPFKSGVVVQNPYCLTQSKKKFTDTIFPILWMSRNPSPKAERA